MNSIRIIIAQREKSVKYYPKKAIEILGFPKHNLSLIFHKFPRKICMLRKTKGVSEKKKREINHEECKVQNWADKREFMRMQNYDNPLCRETAKCSVLSFWRAKLCPIESHSKR